MGIIQSIKNKLGGKSKKKVYTAEEISKLCIGYADEVKLLSHAVDVSKPEDKAYFASRTTRFIDNYAELKKEIAISKEIAEKEVEDFVENGDDILAHHSQEYYDDVYADWKSAPILIQIAETRLDASYTALCNLKEYFEGKSQTYETTLVENIAKDNSTPESLQREAKTIAADEVAAMEAYNPFQLSSGLLSAIGKAASIVTMGMGIAENNAAKTVAGAALYHLNDQVGKEEDQQQPE
ncbi:MAG: hypothetical protein E7341_05635 [Clostridiales bacterium]|nr:hypothetical protein [Clostridiales bacterium]